MVGRDGGLADVSSRRRRSVNGDTYAGGLTLNDLKREPVSWGDFWGQYCEAAYSWYAFNCLACRKRPWE
eukprot:scaffold207_cov409-Prasinococcus_capsulatus_cf.AAC.136